VPHDFIPRYALYGERDGAAGPGFAHVETIHSRSHRNGWEILPHTHAAILQVLIVRSSIAEVTVDGATTRVAGPVAVTIPPGTAHGFRFAPDVVGDVISLSATLFADDDAGAADATIRPLLSAPAVVALDAESEAALSLITQQIAGESDNRRPGHDAMVGLLARALLIAIARRRIILGQPEGGGGRHATQFARFRLLVDRHFREQRPLGFYVDALGISERGLNRLATRMTGRSAKRFVTDRLVIEARRQLAYTNLPVAQIAYGLGFEDPSYFSRFYRRTTGRLPSDERA
jgi:AraC family transcriptional activator of pobA